MRKHFHLSYCSLYVQIQMLDPRLINHFYQRNRFVWKAIERLRDRQKEYKNHNLHASVGPTPTLLYSPQTEA